MSEDLQAISPRAAFQSRPFCYYIGARFLGLSVHQMLGLGLGQFIYVLTKDPLHLGLLGLFFFVPKFAFALFSGHVADQFDRRSVILLCRLIHGIGILGLLAYIALGGHGVWVIYTFVFCLSTANTFSGPASQAILPDLVPPRHFSNAVTWNSSSMQFAFIMGPALGGWIYALGGGFISLLIVMGGLSLIAILLVFLLPRQSLILNKEGFSFKALLAGLHFVFKEKIILGILSLDLFAVLFGGVVALLPVFANDILNVGAKGLGILRAAPSIGAAIVAIGLAYLPPMKHAGKTMFWCVGVFGICTILFGLSTHFLYSFFCLFVLGAADMISVIVRGVVVQTITPPEMRGRVSAVNLVFIGASNELGEFESGITAALMGVIPAVIMGGFCTLLVVSIWTRKFPEILRIGRLDSLRPKG